MRKMREMQPMDSRRRENAETDIVGICPGALVDGKLLCDDCLPPDHPIAF